jgi:hypothetical protein
MDFLWPFLLIILVGIIVALFIQFIFSWLDQKEIEFKNKIYIYLDQGEGQILPWGETEWSRVYDGELVMEGDVIDLGRLSRGVLSFYNGMSVRLDAETKMDIKDVSNGDTGDEFHLNVLNGTLWINVPDEIEMPTRTIVYTDHLKITSYGTIFEVGVTDRETVRVLEGEVLVEVLAEESDREVALEQIKVGVGQQVEMTAEDWEKISTYQTVSLLEAVDDEWKAGTWYTWNIEEDAQPTVYEDEEATTEEVVEDEPSEDIEEEETAIDEEVAEEDEAEDSTAPTLTLTFPESSPYTLPAGELSIALTGTATENTAKVIVTSYDESGAAYPYTLSAYTAGSATWRYNAAAAYDNLREGRNLFTIVAENADGFESAKIEVVIEVLEGALGEEVTEEETTEETAAEEVTIADEEVSSDEGAESESAEEAETESDSASEEGAATDEPLTTPQVSSLNGEALPGSGTYTTGAESVMILGSVSTSAVKVYVNDYQLSKFVAGSGVWSYYAQPEFLNYDVGENVYTVYAEDADGNVSAVLTFTIYRESP